MTTEPSLSRSAEELDQQLSMYPVYGGDVITVLDVVEAIVKKMRFGLFDRPAAAVGVEAAAASGQQQQRRVLRGQEIQMTRK